MLQPRRVKYRKQHRGRMRGMAQKGNTVAFGEFGIQSMEPIWLTGRQIEAARRAMTRHVRRGGQIWIRVFPHKSITKKPLETRMGPARATWTAGWPWCVPAKSCSRLPVFLRMRRAGNAPCAGQAAHPHANRHP